MEQRPVPELLAYAGGPVRCSVYGCRAQGLEWRWCAQPTYVYIVYAQAPTTRRTMTPLQK